MAGSLAGSLAAGGLQGYATGSAQNLNVGAQTNIAQWQNEVRALMDERIAERTKTEEAARHTRDRGEALTDQETAQKNALGLIDARAKAGKDPLDQELKRLQIKVAKDEIKLPPAEKKLFDAYQKEFDTNNAAIAKARAEGTFDESNETTKALMEENRAIRNNMTTLLEPYLQNKPKGKGVFDPNKYVVPGAATDTASPAKPAAMADVKPEAKPEAAQPAAEPISPSKLAVYTRYLEKNRWRVKDGMASRGGMTYPIKKALAIQKRDDQ